MSTQPRPAPAPLLEIRDLTVGYHGRHGAHVLTDANLTAARGELIGLVGETGSGKTTLARAIVGLAPIQSGRIVFDGTDLTTLRDRTFGAKPRRALRRSGRIQFAFQDPLRALDPELTVADIIAEPLTVSRAANPAEQSSRTIEALHQVGLDESFLDRLPGRLSGGQRQRVLLARALITRPSLLICDEPASALDAANRALVLRLLADLRTTPQPAQEPPAILMISHDLHSLASIADRVAVLHQGRIVEDGPVRRVLEDPQHSYTGRLLAAAPRLRRAHATVHPVAHLTTSGTAS